MPDGWRWDSTLFRGSAAHYERGRLPYAPDLARTLAAVLGLDGRGRLLDVGCGPGIVTLAMAPYVAEVIGVDPDEDMLAQAARQAGLRGVDNARWVAARAEELPAGLGEFRAVVFAQSFHWTDRDETAAVVREMLVPGGSGPGAGRVRGLRAACRAGRGRGGPSGGLRRGVGVLPVGLRAPSVRRQTGGLRAGVARAAAGGGARRAFRGVSAADRDHDLAQATNFYRRVTSLRVLTRA